MTDYPILYSFRRCPYAIRARLALLACEVQCELREVVLRDKPKEMTDISPKSTVPVMQLENGDVIDESYDIIVWAVKQNDPKKWAPYLDELKSLVQINDHKFKIHLDKYKYSSRNPEISMEEHRENSDFFLKDLDEMLKSRRFLSSDRQTVTDISVFPFIRQFAFVDKNYFDDRPYPHLQKWLEWHLDSDQFKNIMNKNTQWKNGDEITYFPKK